MASSEDPVPIKTALGNKALAPIILDEFGNQLEEWSPNGSPGHTMESDLIAGRGGKDPQIGIHSICGGAVNRLPSSEKFDVLICRWCLLRVQIPVSIKTFHDLRRYVKSVEDDRRRRAETLRRANNLCNTSEPMG